jgi:hypothetical protein
LSTRALSAKALPMSMGVPDWLYKLVELENI